MKTSVVSVTGSMVRSCFRVGSYHLLYNVAFGSPFQLSSFSSVKIHFRAEIKSNSTRHLCSTYHRPGLSNMGAAYIPDSLTPSFRERQVLFPSLVLDRDLNPRSCVLDCLLPTTLPPLTPHCRGWLSLLLLCWLLCGLMGICGS